MKTYHLVPKQESRTAHEGVFYSSKIYHITVGSNDNFIVSSQPNGLGDVQVDDVLKIRIMQSDDDSTSVSFEHNFGDGGKITPIPPINLNAENIKFNGLRNKTVKVLVYCSDKYAGTISCSNLYLTLTSE